jgi:CheY-like chemotaxis protein
MGKKKILIVDDEVDFTRVLKLNLDAFGKYEVRAENDSSIALDTLRAFKPDLVLLDIMMPAVDGGEIAHQIEEDESLSDTPVVFLTATVTKEEVASSNRGHIGGHVFIAKPVGIKELVACIDANVKK